MSGLVGYAEDRRFVKDRSLIQSMSDEVKYVETDLIDHWSNDYLTIARVHHGLLNREQQPIHNEDKSLNIYMEGEVFDYEQDKKYLQSKGHRFQYEQNDAEYCLHLFEEFGEESFRRLNGSFSIIIYNLQTNDLLLVSDRYASRPQFYIVTNGGMIFGSQLRVILKADFGPRNLDMQSIMEFFTFQRVLGDKTYYRDIRVLPPASIMKYKKGNIHIKKYWELYYKDDGYESDEYYVEKFTDTLKIAVRRRTSDNLRHGLLLSGGLDARGIIAAANKSITALTLGDFYNREVQVAKSIADVKHAKHIFLQRHFDYYVDAVEKGADLGDGMYGFQHAHFHGFIPDIRKECDIVLHGYGFDIFYKGKYFPINKLRILGKQIEFPVLKKLSVSIISQTLLSMSGISVWNDRPEILFADHLRNNYRSNLKKAIEPILNEGLSRAKNYYNLFDYIETYFLQKNYGFLNTLCIKHFMDERGVSLDNDLLQLHLEMPYRLRFNGPVYKKALERINPEIAKIIYANTGLKPSTPKWLEFGMTMGLKGYGKINPPSMPNPAYTGGSWPKFGELIRHNTKMKQLIRDVLNDEKCTNHHIFNREALNNIFEKHLNHQRDYTSFLILILTFGIWHKKYGPN